MRVDWLTTEAAPVGGEDDPGTGGLVYGALAREALGREHDVRVLRVARGTAGSRGRRLGGWTATLRRLGAVRTEGDLVIRDYLPAAFAPFDRTRRQIVLLHHLETFPTPYPWLYRWLNRRVCRRARTADRVVVPSLFWRRELERRGIERVEVIPNGFDLGLFEPDPHRPDLDRLDRLRAEHALPRDRPLVYLGNARPEKGFRRAWESLAALDATFVVTGPGAAEAPIRHLDLPYRDYLALLRLADVAVTMSLFDEGWCRTAHEAMLCGTPVVGSGRGGMAELLDAGGQVICSSFDELLPTVRAALESPELRREMGERGRAYARRFDLDAFSDRWLELVRAVAAEPPD